MELHKALKQIILTEGPDIITDLRVMYILSDLNAYHDIQGAKYIIRAIIDDGFADRFKQIGKLNTQAQDLICKFYTTTGFNADSVTQIFHSIAYGLGWINQLPSYSSNPLPTPPPSPKPTPSPNSPRKSSGNPNLNLTSAQLENKSDAFKHNYAQDAEAYLDSLMTIIGDSKKDLGCDLIANSSFNADYNQFNINVEFEGGITQRFSQYVIVTIVIKSVQGKVMCKEEIWIDKKASKNSYFVEERVFCDNEFHRVGEVGEIKIYWKKD